MRWPDPPRFWAHGGNILPARLLAPAAAITTRITARRVARPGWRAPVPVYCAGNAGLGGAGKTTLALDLVARLLRAGCQAHVLTRGYGGTARGILRADPARHTATDIGDEALLLAQRAPVWVGADRAEAARAAIAAGAEALVMDDGLQNPSLEKDIAFLVVDGAAGFGNGRVIPAGPLREPPQAAAARATACVMIGADDTGAASHLPSQLPILRARLVPGAEIAECAGAAVLAFAGIGRPEKFFTMLEQAGVVIRRRIPFPDHFAYTPAQLARLRREAAALGARAVTTPKDFMRIPAMARAGITPIGVSLAWEDEEALSALLEGRKDVLF